jgi:hypothetical protein
MVSSRLSDVLSPNPLLIGAPHSDSHEITLIQSKAVARELDNGTGGFKWNHQYMGPIFGHSVYEFHQPGVHSSDISLDNGNLSNVRFKQIK